MLEDTLNPKPMLPCRSMAMLPIQRFSLSGEYVPCWKMLVPELGERTS